MKKVVISNIVVAIAFGLVGYWFYSHNMGIGAKQAKAKAEKFITDNLVQPGTEVQIKGVVEESNLYKIDLAVGKQELTAYMSKDGKNFFPQGMNMEEVEKQSASNAKAEEPPVEVPKNDKPVVEMFVMSYCPYGTQIEKGMLPVLDTLGNKIDFKLKFVDYAMHEKKEVDENLRQYCIQKDQPTKLNAYLKCFLKDEKSDECLKSNAIDSAKLATCVKATDTQFKITEQLNNKESWSSSYPPFDVDKADNEKYGVQGSPSLVINGVEAQAGRDSASLLKAVCAAFNNEPEECKKELSAEAPSPGFGEGKAANNSAAECGN